MPAPAAPPYAGLGSKPVGMPAAEASASMVAQLLGASASTSPEVQQQVRQAGGGGHGQQARPAAPAGAGAAAAGAYACRRWEPARQGRGAASWKGLPQAQVAWGPAPARAPCAMVKPAPPAAAAAAAAAAEQRVCLAVQGAAVRRHARDEGAGGGGQAQLQAVLPGATLADQSAVPGTDPAGCGGGAGTCALRPPVPPPPPALPCSMQVAPRQPCLQQAARVRSPLQGLVPPGRVAGGWLPPLTGRRAGRCCPARPLRVCRHGAGAPAAGGSSSRPGHAAGSARARLWTAAGRGVRAAAAHGRPPTWRSGR